MKWKVKLNEQIEKNVALNQRLSESTAQTIINNVVKDLQYPRRRNYKVLQKVLSLKVKNPIVERSKL